MGQRDAEQESETQRVLVPIRYPLTAQTTQTLASAEYIASTYADAELLISHVNLFQYNEHVKAAEIQQAVDPLLDDVPFSISIRQGFLIEEVILEEAKQRNIDIIVIGEKQTPWWQRILTRILRNEPDIVSFLEENTGSDINIEVIE